MRKPNRLFQFLKRMQLLTLCLQLQPMPSKQPTSRTCSNGHSYFKSSDCPVCPICESDKTTAETFLAALSAPARRALENEGITTLKELSRYSKSELLKLHGMGKSSIPKLEVALAAQELHFKN